MTEKFEKFEFENEFFDVAVMDGLIAAPRLPRSLQEARDEGLREGLAQGRAEGDKILQEEVGALKKQIAALTEQLTAQYQQWEKNISTQALSLLRVSLHRIIGHAAEHYSDQMLEHHLRHLLTQLHQGEGLTLRIHPHAKAYHEKLGLPQASIGNIPFKIETDPALGPTDVVMEWPGGGLESKLAEHMTNLDELLKQVGAEELPAPAMPTTSKLQPEQTESPLDEATTASKSRASELLGEDDDLVDALK